MLFDPPPELALEGIVVLELEALYRFCGSKGLARKARVDLLLVCHRTIPRLRLGALVAEVSTVETPQGSYPTLEAALPHARLPAYRKAGSRGGVRRGDARAAWRLKRAEDEHGENPRCACQGPSVTHTLSTYPQPPTP